MPTKRYLDEDFLLHTAAARALYHEFAKTAPVIDYHNHLSPRQIAEDAQFATITALWLAHDHYKWRLMRAHGIDERFITGSASDEEKFVAWAETVSHAVRNPLFDWTHLELKRYFGIHCLLSKANARALYKECNAMLREKKFSAKNLLRTMKVKVLCTTDDPADDLAFHARLHREKFEVTVLPTFRPDKVLAVGNPASFNAYVATLSAASGITITGWDSLVKALDIRHRYFHDHGCRCADFSLAVMPYEPCTARQLKAILSLVCAGKTPSPLDCARYTTELMRALCTLNHQRGWVQQMHFGVTRNARARLFSTCGPDAGGDCMGDCSNSQSLCRFLDSLDEVGHLAKTILYNINPRDNELFTTIAGSFQDGTVPGKMQFGPAWWFMDHKDGMIRQLNALSSSGMLSGFIGMTTDSRSLLSFVRHEYFRRILCNLIGGEMERGELPSDQTLMGGLVQDICFNNAQRYFNFPVFTTKKAGKKT